jgi:hypothetical protein
MQVTAAKEPGQSQAEFNPCPNHITSTGTPAVVSFSNLFEFDSTDLDLNMASDFPRVVRINLKDNAEDMRNRPRFDKSWFK